MNFKLYLGVSQNLICISYICIAKWSKLVHVVTMRSLAKFHEIGLNLNHQQDLLREPININRTMIYSLERHTCNK